MKKFAFAITAAVAAASLSACGGTASSAPSASPLESRTYSAPSASPTPTRTATPTPTRTVVPTPTPVATTVPAAQTATTVLSVIDGDTISTSEGKVRLIGIDTPEKGQCNYAAATQELQGALSAHGNQVVLMPGKQEDKDKYGRLLRYVQTADDGTDLNLHMVQTGLATARYDSRDGYGAHEREAAYIAADNEAAAPSCEVAPVPQAPAYQAPEQPAYQAPEPQQPVAPEPAYQEPQGGAVYYPNCAAARAAGAAPLSVGSPGYSSKLDRDGDGTACE